MLDLLLILSFIVGFVPAVLFLLFYGVRSRWRETQVGRAMFIFALVTASSYALSILALAWPDFFTDDTIGVWFRIIGRVLIALMLWNLLRVLLRVQRGEDQKV